MKQNKTIKMLDVEEEIPKPIIKVEERRDGNYIPLDGLPSKGMNNFYPEGIEILARPMNVSEVKLLASMDENNYEQIINEVIKRTVKGIDTNEILRSDKYYIICWLRANTYKQSGYEMDFICENPECLKPSKYNFTVEVFEIVYANEIEDLSEDLKLPVSLEEIKVKYIRIKDENKIRDFIKMTGANSSKYDPEFLELAATIDFPEKNKSLREKYEFIEKMSPIDFSKLIEFIDKRTFGIKQVVKAKCGHCKGETPVGVFFRKEFFLPKC